MADSSFIDPSSAVLFFDVNNNGTTAQTSTAITRVQTLGQAHVLFSCVRLLMQGQVVEDIFKFWTSLRAAFTFD